MAESLLKSQTIAEMYIEQGRVEGENKGKRATQLRQLRKRFKRLPRKVESRIAATNNLNDLEAWLDNFANAAALVDVGIPLD